MTMRSAARKQRTTSGARDRFRESFVCHVHRIVAMGYARLSPRSLQTKHEPAISGDLVKAMREAIEDMNAPLWARRYSVHDDRPITDHPSEGKHRPRIDIEIEWVGRGPRPRFQFEAKRLGTNSGVSGYLGAKGMGSFLSGDYYAVGHQDAGMLGYVQEATAMHWVSEVHSALDRNRTKYGIDSGGPGWVARGGTGEITPSYKSVHRLGTVSIVIHHTFLLCY